MICTLMSLSPEAVDSLVQMYPCDPSGLDGFVYGAAAAFGLIGMFEAIRARVVCPECEGHGANLEPVNCWTCRGSGENPALTYITDADYGIPPHLCSTSAPKK